jgi:hypothetical protein
MSVGFNVFLHMIFVLLCVGLGYVLRWSLEEFKELDQHIARMKQPEHLRHDVRHQHVASQQPPLSNMSNNLQSKADPAKLAELKANMKK